MCSEPKFATTRPNVTLQVPPNAQIHRNLSAVLKRQNGKSVQTYEDLQNLQDCQNVKFTGLFCKSNGSVYKLLCLDIYKCEMITHITSYLCYLSKLNR